MNKILTWFLTGVVIVLLFHARQTEERLNSLQLQLNAQDAVTAEHVRNLYRELRK